MHFILFLLQLLIAVDSCSFYEASEHFHEKLILECMTLEVVMHDSGSLCSQLLIASGDTFTEFLKTTGPTNLTVKILVASIYFVNSMSHVLLYLCLYEISLRYNILKCFLQEHNYYSS